MAKTAENQLPKPITFTIMMVLAVILTLPIPGIDVIVEILAACLVGSKWLQYAEAAKQIAGATRQQQSAGSAASLRNAAHSAALKKNFQEAIRLYQLAAQEGDTGAMNDLGTMYHDGNGIPVNYRLAAQWYEKAIAKGERRYAPGNIELVGTVFFLGKKAPQNYTETARLWRIAANTGLAEGQFDMGLLHSLGVGGVARDSSLARHWYGLAAAQGHQKALEELKRLDDEQGGGGHNSKMTRAVALELLGLQEGATKVEMKKAYMGLMQNVHPDKGGSNYFAKQLNEAREVLGF